MGLLHVNVKVETDLLHAAQTLAERDHSGNLSEAMRRIMKRGVEALQGIGVAVRESMDEEA